MPFFNRQNNDDLILAIQAAGVSSGRNGFRKDKGGEKLAESEVIGLPLSQLAEKEHSSNTAPTAPMLLILSTSERKNFRIGKVMLSQQREFCSVAVNGEALASGLAVLVGEAGARSLASKTHRKNSHTEMLSA